KVLRKMSEYEKKYFIDLMHRVVSIKETEKLSFSEIFQRFKIGIESLVSSKTFRYALKKL
ncbi:hypothetical protein, partial [Holospora obtusa]|uniref:hypothetical protein n=1 Tax=Holospora obtusa TaxID=49893 RepID=UPI00058F90FD